MQDPKNNSSIFSFKKTQLRFLWSVLAFFIPVVLVVTILELLVLGMPANYKNNSNYFTDEKENITTAVFGSSQMDGAINPAYFSEPGICFASKGQHHGLDNAIFTQTFSKMPKLKTVVFELSYAHLELGHNSKEYWKNNIYYKYYDVNAFDRNTYFKDNLIYLSNPDIYSRALKKYYINNKDYSGLNKYGVDTVNFTGIFFRMNFDEEKIAQLPITIRTTEQPKTFAFNTAFFFNMLDDAASKNLNVVVCTLPLDKNYLAKRNPNILRRRDSILGVIKVKYSNVRILYKEEDTINFSPSDFRNHNHLNPRGAQKFTTILNDFIHREFQKN